MAAFVEKHNTIDYIANMAVKADNLALRGFAHFHWLRRKEQPSPHPLPLSQDMLLCAGPPLAHRSGEADTERAGMGHPAHEEDQHHLYAQGDRRLSAT